MKKESVANLQEFILQSGVPLPKWGADGYFGAETSHAIENIKMPNWVKIAMKEVGVTEISGERHSDRVMEYHKVSGNWSRDEIPWCGSFVNWVMLKSGFEKTVKIPARAKSWLSFGKSSQEPVIGSIAVKSRKGGGHVCFVIGKDSEGRLLCLGGNQNDEVNIKTYNKDVFIDFRVPHHYNGSGLNRYALNSGGRVREA